MEHHYTEPVSRLLTVGERDDFGRLNEWPDYCETFWLTAEHIPELIRMVSDDDLHTAGTDTIEVWAPVHAWRALAQLQAVEAAEALVNLYTTQPDDDWVSNELPYVFGMIGNGAIPLLTRAFKEPKNDVSTAIGIASCVKEIGTKHPDARDECVAALMEMLKRFRHFDPELNGFLIWFLSDLMAVEAMPLIREAFEQEYVNYTVVGDVEDVELKLGLRTERSAPADHPTIRDQYPGLDARLDGLFGDTRKCRKIGRNEPCPCGSGKKYKKCCQNNPDGPVQRDFLAMFSTKRFDIPLKKKEELVELVRQGRQHEALTRVKHMTGADTRLVEDYVKRLENL